MGNNITLAICLCLPLLAAGTALAKEAPKRHAVLQKAEENGGKVDYLGSAYGLDGWVVVTPEGGVQYAYTTADGALLTGMLFAPDGTLETMRQVKAYKQRMEGAQDAVSGASKAASKSEKLYADASAASWVGIGNSNAPYLYVFMNTGCPHCQDFWKDVSDTVKQGKLQIRFVPYGMSEENRDGAAALLSSEDPVLTWENYVAGDKAVLSKDKVKEGAYDKVDANTNLARTWNLGMPPFTIYRRPADGAVMALSGRPENKMLLLADFLK